MLLLCITRNFFYALLYQLYFSKNMQHFPVFPELLFWMFSGVLVKTFFFPQIFCGHMLFHASEVQDKLITVITIA